MALADTVEPVYARLLRLLEDCEEYDEDHPLHAQQHQGATFKTLAAIAYAAGMSKEERTGWYRVAESVPLSQRHAGHLLTKLRKE